MQTLISVALSLRLLPTHIHDTTAFSRSWPLVSHPNMSFLISSMNLMVSRRECMHQGGEIQELVVLDFMEVRPKWVWNLLFGCAEFMIVIYLNFILFAPSAVIVGPKPSTRTERLLKGRKVSSDRARSCRIT